MTEERASRGDDLDIAWALVMDVEKRLEVHGDAAPIEARATLAVAGALVSLGEELRSLREELRERRA